MLPPLSFLPLNPRQYFLLVVFLGSAAFGLGHALVDYLRVCCRSSKNIQRLSGIVFLTPFCIFVVLNVLLLFGFAERMLCDALSFGVAVGILFRLSYKPTGPSTVKLIAQELNARSIDVWLDATDLSVGEVRNKIAEALNISPVGRVAIESGKGSFVEDNNKKFTSIIDESMKTVDFFGFVTLRCFIKIKEEERRKLAEDGIVLERRGSMGSQFLNILQKSDIKFGESLALVAKIAASADFRSHFQVACVDRFAAAAPSSQTAQIPQIPLVNNTAVKIHAWAGGDDGKGDGFSDAGDSVSNVSSTPGSRSSPLMRFHKKSKDKSSKAGTCLCNGDVIVLEYEGKYMSVTRGWWMAWSSSEPRRSGAFIIDIVERAPQNKLKEQLENIKEKILLHSTTAGNSDDTLKPGDIFRLRSLKFPEFELGLTSVKLRDDYCYLGLRKSANHVQGGDDTWCMEMRFSFKA